MINTSDLELFLEDECGRALFDMLGLRHATGVKLMLLLASGSTGVIDVDEFCQGCLNVQGEARSFDLHFLMVEHRRALYKWGEFMGFVEDHIEDVEARMMR